jgi:hypothetical protein
VPRRSKHTTSTGHTCREPYFQIRLTKQSAVKIGVKEWYNNCYEYRAAFDVMEDCAGKIDRYTDRAIEESIETL